VTCGVLVADWPINLAKSGKKTAEASKKHRQHTVIACTTALLLEQGWRRQSVTISC